MGLGPARLQAGILFVVVAVAPLPFGSVDLPAVAVLVLLLGAALVLSDPSALRGPRVGPPLVLLGLALAYGVVAALQLGAFGIAPPHPAWAATAGALPAPPAPAIARTQPLFALGGPLLALEALLVGYMVGLEAERAQQLLRTVAWSGLAVALAGTVLFLADPGQVLWWRKLGHGNSLTAFFLNRNTAAAYFGVVAIVWILFVWRVLIRDEVALGALLRPRKIGPAVRRRLAVPLAGSAVTLAALLLTASRAGVVLSLAALVLASALALGRRLAVGTGLLVLAGAGALMLVVLQIVASGLATRFDQNGIGDPGRLGAYRSALRMIADHPGLGSGLGTFAAAFPPYRDPAVTWWGLWDRAHDTLLELAVEMGLPMALLLACAWAALFARLVQGVRRRRRDRIVPIAALSAGALAGLHSLVDFSLQIPGFAVPVYAMLGAGLAQSFRRGD